MFSGTIIGRLARDAESRTTGNGTPIATFIVPNDTGYGDRKKTDWVRVTVFGKAADFCGRLVKGDIVSCAGQVSTEEWTNKDGVTKTTLRLTADKVDRYGYSLAVPPHAPKPTSGGPIDDDDGSVPF